jgi:hypothetical protein
MREEGGARMTGTRIGVVERTQTKSNQQQRHACTSGHFQIFRLLHAITRGARL